MLLTKELEIKWHQNNRRHYEEKGYKFTQYGDTFICKIEDVMTGIKKRVRCLCDYCNEEYTPYYYHYTSFDRTYVNKDACSKCKRIKEAEILRTKNKPIYTEKIYGIGKEKNYIILDFEYKGEDTKIPYICKKHIDKGIQKSSYASLSQGHGCYYCGREKTIKAWKFTYEEVKEQIECSGKNKLLSTQYTRCKDWNLSVSCEECGKPFIVSLDYYKRENKTKCNDCTCSYGEKCIYEYLTDKKIYFEREKEIYIYNREYPLRLDFCIDNQNLVIEFDGEQHYFPVNFDGYSIERFQREFEELQIRDKIKNKYCLENNITLIRIPYWERENIKNVLDDYFINNSQQYVVKDIDHIAIQTAQTA